MLAELPSWSGILAEANVDEQVEVEHISPGLRWTTRRRRLVLLAAACFVAAAAPLTALAVTQHWWFLAGKASPAPLGKIVVVRNGKWGKTGWALAAYRTRLNGLCFSFNPLDANGQVSSGASISCERLERSRVAPLSIGYVVRAARQGSIGYVAGVAPVAATRIELDFGGAKREQIVVFGSTHLPPAARFFVSELAEGTGRLRALVARDRDGRVITRVRIPVSVGHTDLARVNSGKRIPLSPQMRHVLRLAHRSTDIELLASRVGLNFYRFGRNGCWGVGKTLDPLALPATRTGISDLGVVLCSPEFPSAAQPVLDLSIYGRSVGSDGFRILRLSGFAGNDVKEIRLANAAGRTVATVPVVDNVYALPRVPDGVVLVEPVDVGGRVLAQCPAPSVITNGSYLAARC